MHRINDAKAVLKSASDKFSNIKTLYNRCEYDDSLSSELKLEIKYFLESIRSCLDYTTNYIFDTRCKENYSEKELPKIARSIYFPNRKNKKLFYSYISNNFLGLDLTEPIVLLWANNQLFNKSTWVANLCALTNTNKHIELVKHTRSESGTIKFMKIGGTTFENCSFENCNHAFSIDDKPVSIKEFKTNPHIKGFKGTIKASYTFAETNTPIIETLEEILNAATLYFDEFKTII